MAKKQSASSAPVKQAGRKGRHIPDSEIDFSDISESTELELQTARRVGRPKKGNAKQLIAIRIDPGLLTQLRRLAENQDKPYQTLIHEILEKATKKAA